MRPEPEFSTTPQHRNTTTAAAPTANNQTSDQSPCDTQIHDCRWWPYTNSNDFGPNAAMLIIILLCAFICALALNTAIRCFLRGSRNRGSDNNRDEQRKKDGGPPPELVAPVVVYHKGMELGGGNTDCAICLSEFVEGDGIRVLGKCRHGFHDHCIEKWLSGSVSCPICRCNCLVESDETGKTRVQECESSV